MHRLVAALIFCGLAGCVAQGKPGEPGASGKYEYQVERTWNKRTHEASARVKLDLSKLDNACGIAEWETAPIAVAYDEINGAKVDQLLFDALMRKFDGAQVAEPSEERRVCLTKLQVRMQTLLRSCPLPFAPCAFQSVQASNP